MAWIGFDLDGTAADHYWDGETVLYDPLKIGKPIAPIIDKIRALRTQGFEVRIFTARVGPPNQADWDRDNIPEDVQAIHRGARRAIEAAIARWCEEHIGEVLPITCVKDYGMICLYDDRCVQVEHNTGAVLGREFI